MTNVIKGLPEGGLQVCKRKFAHSCSYEIKYHDAISHLFPKLSGNSTKAIPPVTAFYPDPKRSTLFHTDVGQEMFHRSGVFQNSNSRRC